MDLFDIFQQFRIESNSAQTTNAKRRASEASFESGMNSVDIKVLEDKVDHLSLVSMAMCELLEEIGFNKKMLEAKIREIDLRDGKVDGKFVEKKTCSGCSRELAARHVRCMYCGTKV